MKVCIASLEAVAPYSQSRAHETPKLDKEGPDEYEKRTWREKAHAQDGKVYIDPMAFKFGLDKAAQMLRMKIKGKGNSEYKKFFLAGVLCTERVFIGDVASMQCERVYAHANGVRGSGKRVWRLFPRFDTWKADVRFDILADEITKEVFEVHLRQAGAFVGIGRFRPENGGYFGRYKISKLKWS